MQTSETEATPGELPPSNPPPPTPSPRGRWYQSIHPPVFWPALIIVVSFVAIATLGGDAVTEAIATLQSGIVGGFGWYYTVIVTGFVLFALWCGFGHFGDIKLAKNDEDPEFSIGSWLAMLFAAGMGIGLVFWGVAEPLHHFAGIPNRASGVAAMDEQGIEDSLVMTFLHWGLHPWAIYVVVGLAVAYAVHVKGRPISIRWTLEPLFGGRVKGWLGDVIDVAAIVGTLFGVATSLGVGVAQVAGGLEFLEIIGTPSNLTLAVLIGAITLLAVISVVTGVKKGMKWLSNINMGMAIGLLVFVLIAGPTLFLLREYIQATGAYLHDLVRLSFSTSALAVTNAEGVEWQGWWTAFYWGWWISWAPFVGVFIARISRGRTVREFVLGVLFVPTVFSFLWFTVLGGTAMYREVFGEGGLVRTDAAGENVVHESNTLFGMLEGLPGGTVVAGLAILLVVLFFVTSSDSGSLVVDMLASGGNPEPPTWSRVLWGVLEGAVALALVFAGGLMALRGVAIAIALPFSVVMVLMVFACLKQFRTERRQMVAAQRAMVRDRLTEHVSRTLIEDGLVEPPRRRP
ncbi:BCCT family transporter [Occultella glacieicola]|uniref:BCCT family transporter n=1 Tax=Occultella glacieicola TaxID=2518684 RepID=A0ABY2E9D7_9MICO|nr:BCCT family transporter [Occultella glacieicola]TDE99109.1 BCCT family transporter [Occultella glacieicola]